MDAPGASWVYTAISGGVPGSDPPGVFREQYVRYYPAESSAPQWRSPEPPGAPCVNTAGRASSINNMAAMVNSMNGYKRSLTDERAITINRPPSIGRSAMHHMPGILTRPTLVSRRATYTGSIMTGRPAARDPPTSGAGHAMLPIINYPPQPSAADSMLPIINYPPQPSAADSMPAMINCQAPAGHAVPAMISCQDPAVHSIRPVMAACSTPDRSDVTKPPQMTSSTAWSVGSSEENSSTSDEAPPVEQPGRSTLPGDLFVGNKMIPIGLDWPHVILSQINLWKKGMTHCIEKHVWIDGFLNYERTSFIKFALEVIGVDQSEICEVWTRMENLFLESFWPPVHKILILHLGAKLYAKDTSTLFALFSQRPFMLQKTEAIMQYTEPWHGLCFVFGAHPPQKMLEAPARAIELNWMVYHGQEVGPPKKSARPPKKK